MSPTDPPPGKVIIDGKESNSGSNTNSNSNTIQEGEEGANEELQVPLPMVTRFPIKLMQILDDNAHSEVIQWLPHGRGFLISNKKRFAEEILPKYFKESKYTSFTRRLNRWNFVIQTHGRSKASYFHPSFVRDGDHNALLDMQPQPQTKNRKRSKSSSSAGGSGGRKGRAGRQQEEGKEDPSSSSSGGNNRAAAAATSSSSSLPPSNVASMMGGYSGAGAAAAMYGQQQHHPQYPSQEHHQQLPMFPMAQQQAHQMMQQHQAQQQHQQNLTERGRSASISGTGPGSGGYHPSGGDSSSSNAMNSSMNTNLGMAPLPWNPHQQQQHPQQSWNNPRQPYGPHDGSYDGGGGARGSTAAGAGDRDSSSSLPANSNQSAADASGAAIGTGNSTANNPINSPPHYFHNNSNPYFPILQGGQRQGGGPGQQYQGGIQDRRQENRDQQSSGASHHYGQHQQFEYGDGRPSGGSNLAMRMQDAANQQRVGGDGFYNRNYFSQHSGFPGDFNGMMRSSNYGTQPGDQMANPPRYSPCPVGGGVGNPQQPEPYSPSYNQQQQRQQMFPFSSYGGQYGDFSRQDNRGTHVDVRQGQSQSANSNSTMRGAGDTGSDLNIMVDPPLSTQPQQYQEGGTYPDTGASTTYPGRMSSSGFGFSADQLASNTNSGGSGAADLTMNQFFDPPRGHIASSSVPASSQMQQGRLYGAMERLPNVPMGEPRGFGDNFPHDSGNVITIGRPSSGVDGGSSSAPNTDVKDSAYAPLDHSASGAIPAPPPSSLFDDKAVPYKSEAD